MDKSDIVNEDIREISCEIEDISHNLEDKTVLLAGGAGFLGKYMISTFDHLNKNLLKKPCNLIVLDNFITGLRENVPESENITLIKHDISEEFKTDENIDYIIHAASLASPVFYNKFKLETINAGFLGTRNLLELAKVKNLKNFLFFSSSEVYGNPLPEFIPTKEDYFGHVSCNGPRACYDESKRIGETLCVSYGDIHDIPIKIVRPFNIYGPGMRLDDGRVMANFVVAAIEGKKIPLYRRGNQTRTFGYVSDATAGWFKALLSNEKERVFNIGNDDQEIKMKHLAELVLGLVGNKSSAIEYVEDTTSVYRDNVDPDRRCPDLTKSRELLNYKAKTNLVYGVKKFIGWVEEELDNRRKGLEDKT
ncbi:MAG: NAD-dependent epimerase/dehydratase family protein [Nanoarchaeota archaeon]|nr:NAD-dependent epimerase/dehydratase family protein [Nanoarchaeota archaeon]MBU1501362.1 NAD-dependent epimerase/dehydratase family protein [Nanoarchaeota archaeon]